MIFKSFKDHLFFQGITFNKLKTFVHALQQQLIMYISICMCMIQILTQLFGSIY